MLIEKLEERRLFSATIKPAEKITVESVFTFFAVNPGVSVLYLAESLGSRQEELGHFLMSAFIPKSLHADSSAATAPTTHFDVTLTMESSDSLLAGTFNPASLEPFGSVYTFQLNAKNPLNVFNITQKIGKEKLHFTGKLNSKLTVLSGVLKVTGPTNQISLTYKTTSG